MLTLSSVSYLFYVEKLKKTTLMEKDLVFWQLMNLGERQSIVSNTGFKHTDMVNSEDMITEKRLI